MSLLTRAQLRFLWRARGSVLSALLGMIIGVASVTGVHLLSADVAREVRTSAQPVGELDLYLQRAALTEDDYFALRARWRAGEWPQVANLVPLVEGRIDHLQRTWLVVGTDPLAVGVTVTNTVASNDGDRAHPETGSSVDTSAQPLSALATYLTQDSIYVAPAFAESVGAQVLINGHQLQILGANAASGVVLADIPTARKVLGSDAMSISRIGVRLRSTNEGQTLADEFRTLGNRLFPGALAEPAALPLANLDSTETGARWMQTPAAQANPTQNLLRAVLFNIAALSVLALVVAWLLTYQVASHALARRRAMFVRLQSLGVARGRLLRGTVVEGLLLGALATLFGVLVGVWLANLLLSLALGDGALRNLPVDRWVWGKAIVSGVAVAGGSYLLAARATLSAAAPGAQPERSAPWWGIALLAGLFAVGLLVPGTGLTGAFACIVACCLLLVLYLPAVARWVWRRSLGSTSTPLNLLGLRQVLVGRELKLGVSALTLALATALGLSIMVDSFRGAFVNMLDRRLADDVVLQFSEPPEDRERSALEHRIQPIVDRLFWRGTIEVSVAGDARTGDARTGDARNSATGQLEFADKSGPLLRRFLNLTEPLAADAVVVNESFTRLHSLFVGDSLVINGRRGSAEVRLAGVFKDYGELRPRLLGQQSLARQVHGEAPLDSAFVQSGQLDELRRALEAPLEANRVTWQNQAEVRARSLEIFEQTFAITRALTWLALLVAVVALANALAAHSLQQEPTSSQLRVLGASRIAQRGLRTRRTLYATLAALVLAIPLGLAIAALLCGLINPRAFGWSFPLRLTPAGYLWPLTGGLLAGVLAAGLGGLIARSRGRPHTTTAATGVAQSTQSLVLAGALLLPSLGCAPDPVAQESESVAHPQVPGLRVGNVLGSGGQPAGVVDDGFLRARAVKPFRFPADHGPHPGYRSEWWYLTCPLMAEGATSNSAPREFGVQFTLFRQALVAPGQLPRESAASAWRSGQLYMAHAALTDVSQREHVESTRFARGHPQLAGVRTEPFAAWLENWRLAATQPAPERQSVVRGLDALTLSVNDSAFVVELSLLAQKPVVLQGNAGLSYKGSREASYYYSLPRMSAAGVVGLGATPSVAVSGHCWLDREWSTSVLADDLLGWDWLALQFEDNTELMLFQLRPRDATRVAEQPRRQGKWVASNGRAEAIDPEAIELTPQRYWQDEVGVRWPVEWLVRLGSRELRIVAALEDQRMRSSVAYWEGLVHVYSGSARIGQGYLEMTGYEPGEPAAALP